ncbi:unnamed protein product [Boreogadus saida]
MPLVSSHRPNLGRSQVRVWAAALWGRSSVGAELSPPVRPLCGGGALAPGASALWGRSSVGAELSPPLRPLCGGGALAPAASALWGRSSRPRWGTRAHGGVAAPIRGRGHVLRGHPRAWPPPSEGVAEGVAAPIRLTSAPPEAAQHTATAQVLQSGHLLPHSAPPCWPPVASDSHGTGSPIGPPVASLSPALLSPVSSSSWSARGRQCTVRSLRRRDRILRPPDDVYPGATSPE